MDPFLGQIAIGAFSYAPQGWALCNGAILPIAQNQALNALIGGIYKGGDGRTTFALPDLRGRTPVHRNYSTQDYAIGKAGGTEGVVLSTSNMPAHIHDFNVTAAAGTKANAAPTGTNVVAAAGQNLYGTDSSVTAMNAATCSATGGSAAHNNMQPSLALNFVIATVGLFPPRD